MVVTEVFCAMFLYWCIPSFASLPLRCSTHISMKRTMIGSSELSGVERDLNERERVRDWEPRSVLRRLLPL
jgi:hypothetical protein